MKVSRLMFKASAITTALSKLGFRFPLKIRLRVVTLIPVFLLISERLIASPLNTTALLPCAISLLFSILVYQLFATESNRVSCKDYTPGSFHLAPIFGGLALLTPDMNIPAAMAGDPACKVKSEGALVKFGFPVIELASCDDAVL